MTGDSDNKGNGHGLDSFANDSSASPYSHSKEEEVRSFFVLCLATILLAMPFGLAVVLLEHPLDDPILISVYFWLALAAVIYYPFMILRSPAEIYIADAYDDTATRMAKIAGLGLFAYALLWGVNLLLLTNAPPWRTAQGPLARMEIVEDTPKWTEDRYYEFRFQLANVPGWFHYRDPDQNRIQNIYDRMMHVERGGPFIMEDDAEDTTTPDSNVSIAEAVKQVEKSAPKSDTPSVDIAAAGRDDVSENAEMTPPTPDAAGSVSDEPPQTGSTGTGDIEMTVEPEKQAPARLSVGFRANHGWVNAVMPPAWAFMGENTQMDVKALMLDEDLVVFDKSRSLSLRITSLIWFVMCVMAGSASLLSAKLRGLKGQEAEASKRNLLSRRAEETRAFEAKLAELGLDEHLTEIQKSALINPLHKKQDRPQ